MKAKRTQAEIVTAAVRVARAEDKRRKLVARLAEVDEEIRAAESRP